jgi:hypothetical protein
MTPEDCPWTTWVYGLLYPDPTGVFYIGVSVSPTERFGAHWAAAGDCSSSIVIRPWKEAGWKFGHIFFGEFDDRVDALRLERALITNVPRLANSQHGGALLSRYLYPPDERDEVLLAEALKHEFWAESPVHIDTSGEYVDERYDELDLIEAP